MFNNDVYLFRGLEIPIVTSSHLEPDRVVDVIKRSWRDRLFSLPWHPTKKYKITKCANIYLLNREKIRKRMPTQLNLGFRPMSDFFFGDASPKILIHPAHLETIEKIFEYPADHIAVMKNLTYVEYARHYHGEFPPTPDPDENDDEPFPDPPPLDPNDWKFNYPYHFSRYKPDPDDDPRKSKKPW